MPFRFSLILSKILLIHSWKESKLFNLLFREFRIRDNKFNSCTTITTF